MNSDREIESANVLLSPDFSRLEGTALREYPNGTQITPRWLAAFAFYYNYQRPNQALDNHTSVGEVTNS